MAVLRLSDGSLWVHSPVRLDDTLAAALDELGEVKHIVSPNNEHVKYAPQVSTCQFCMYMPLNLLSTRLAGLTAVCSQWIERYPNAKSYACPGLREKSPDVPYSSGEFPLFVAAERRIKLA